MANNAEFGSIGDGGDRKDKKVKRSQFTSKNLNGATSYLTSDAKQAFTELRQAFTKTPILQSFEPECHIRIKIDTSGHVIRGVLSQLISDNLS